MYFHVVVDGTSGRRKDNNRLVAAGIVGCNNKRLSMGSTEVVNHTSKAMKVKVGFNRVFRDLATVEKDGVYKIAVDPNSTYQQFSMGVDAAGKPIIVDSDQLVDNMCITIAESDDGNFQVLKVPRRFHNSRELQEASCTTPPSPAAAASVPVDPLRARKQAGVPTSWVQFWKS